MKFRKLLLPFALIASLGTLFLSGCGRHHHDPEEKAEYVVHKISKKLDLTDEQKAKLEAVKVELMQHYQQHREMKKTMMNTLLAEVQKPQLDQAVLLDMVSQHKAQVDLIAPGVIEKLADFHASLSADQKAEIAEKMQKFQKHHSS